MFLAVLLAFSLAASQPLILQARNTIEGRVMTPDSRPVVNARVFLQNDSYSDLASMYTDGTGRYSFKGFPSGIYNIVIEPTDGLLERQSQRVEAEAFNGRGSGRGGEVFRVDFVLNPKKPVRKKGEPLAPGTNNTVFYQEVPEAAKKEYDNALKNLEKNESEQGLNSLKQSIQLFPDYYEALDRLGAEYVKRREFDSAIPVLQHAVEVNKDGWTSFYYLGVAQLEMKQADEGVRALRRAVEINPNSVNANMRLGMILASNKDTQPEAIKSFKKVAELSGKQVPDAYFYLAKLYSEQKQYREAADALESYMKVIPHLEPQQREQYEKAIKQLRQKASK